MKRKKIIKLLLLSLTSVGFQSMTPPITSALTYQNSVDVEFTLNPAISISLSDDNLVIDNLVPGSSNDSNIITVNVATNASSGYYVSATAGTKTGNTNLVSSTSNTVFTNLSSNAATLNDIPSDRWGYSYSKDNGTTWVSGDTTNTSTGYNGLPLDNDDSGATGVIILNTDSFSNTGSFKFKIGAKASPTQASGIYTNTVNFYAVANPEPTLGPVDCEPGNICYNVNSLTATEGTMGMQSASDGSNVTLLASNFSKHGYGFAGWSDTYDYSGNLYGPQETITVPTGTTDNGLSLYAIWVKSEGSFQDPTKVAQVCGRLTAASSATKTLNSVSALTDERDNNTYAIAKLADGKCWMIENLRLDNSATLTIANTNNPLNDGTNVTLKHSYSDTETHNTLSASQDPTATAWCQSNSASCDDQSMLFTGNTTNRASSPTANSVAMYSYGNYYNWYSATAGRGTYSFSTDNNSVAGDLCPAGWHLPKGGNKSNEANNEFWSLVVTGINGGTNPADYESSTTPFYNGTPEGTDASNKLRAYPNNFVYSGSVGGGSVRNRGWGGDFWSSTANSSPYAYFLYLFSSGVYPGTNYGGSKYYGRAVRCVAPGV